MQIQEHVEKWLRAHHQEVLGWRRHIHAHPELSHMEYATTQFIADRLREAGLSPELFPNSGLMVDIGPRDGERLAFRADIDALPIQEETGLAYASTVSGVSHSCGHDMHTTIALALACSLADAPLDIPVRVIFQPAEEVLAGGASEVISYGALAGVGAIYAFHMEPKLRVGRIGVRAGAITSATDIIDLTVLGPGGHSSRPHLTADVVYALGEVITQLPALLSRRVDPRTGTVVVFGTVNAGYAPNAIPTQGTATGTVRTADIGVWRMIEGLINELVEQILSPTGCTYQLSYQRGVPPVLNDDVATSVLAEAAGVRDPQAVVEAPQSSGGEDFSWYLEQVPGSMGRLGCWSGVGDPQDLHQGDLLVDERALEVGLRTFAAVVDHYQGAAS